MADDGVNGVADDEERVAASDLAGPHAALIYGPQPPELASVPRRFRIGGGRPPMPAGEFVPPDDKPVLVVTHVIELPFDIGVPSDKNMVKFGGRQDALGSWSPESQGALITGSALAPGVSPVERLWFRRAWVSTALPSEGADYAFGMLTRRHLGRRGWRRRQAVLRWMSKRGHHGVRTVVAATYWADSAQWPIADPAAQDAFLSTYLDRALVSINALVTNMALVRADGMLRPVVRADLPMFCPVIIDAIDAGLNPAGVSTSYRIHANMDMIQAHEIDADAFAGAFIGATRIHQGEDAFHLCHELLVSSLHSARQHQWSEVAVSLGTTVEVFVAATVREASPLIGEPATRTKQVLETAWRNILEQHLQRYAPISIDLQDRTTALGRWWSDGYALRNAVVHDGHRATEGEANDALASTIELIREIKDALASQPQTASVADQIFIG